MNDKDIRFVVTCCSDHTYNLFLDGLTKIVHTPAGGMDPLARWERSIMCSYCENVDDYRA